MEKSRANSVRSVSQGVPPRTSETSTLPLKKKLRMPLNAPKTLPVAIKTATSPNRFGSLGTTAKTTPSYVAPEKGNKLKKVLKAVAAPVGRAIDNFDKKLSDIEEERRQHNVKFHGAGLEEQRKIEEQIRKKLQEQRKKESKNIYY